MNWITSIKERAPELAPLSLFIASPKGEAISDCAQGECRAFSIVLICLSVCLSVCKLRDQVYLTRTKCDLVCPPSQVYRHIQVTLGQVTIVTHARDWLELDQR